MKTLSRYLYLFSFTLLLSACGGGKGGPNSNAGSGGSGGANGNTPQVDNSKPFTQQIQQVFSKLKPNSQFYNVKIKSITHPKELVDTWTMWSYRRADSRTLKQDGSCEEKTYWHLRQEHSQLDCKRWYNVTLEDNTSLLLILNGDTSYSIESYEWSDGNNIYFHYSDSTGHLATRAKSDPIAKAFEARPLYGTWSSERLYYGDFIYYHAYLSLNANNKLQFKGITDETKEVLFNDSGTWSFNNTGTLELSIPAVKRAEKDSPLALSAPPSSFKLSFLHGNDYLTYGYNSTYYRYSEPVMVSGDPFVGRFQGIINHGPLNPTVAMTLIVSKQANDYLVDIYIDNQVFKKLNATLKDDYLNIQTSNSGTLLFKTVTNGIQQLNNIPDYDNDNIFAYAGRLLRTSIQPVKSSNTPNIIGKWAQMDTFEKYSQGHRINTMSFLSDGSYSGRQWIYDSYFGFTGSYRTEGKKLYVKQFCKPEKLYSFELNTEHITLNTSAESPEFNKGSYIKIKNSPQRIRLNDAMIKLKNNAATQALRSHPKQSGKYVFAKTVKYGNSYSAPGSYDTDFYYQSKTYTFAPNGVVNVFLFDSVIGSLSTSHSYYIEAKKGAQKKIVIGDKRLAFNQAESLLCIDNKEVIQIQK